MSEIAFKGELRAIAPGAALVLKANQPLTRDQAERIKAHCRDALGAEQKILVIGPELTPVEEPKSRLFTGKNAPEASVYDVDTKQKKGHVLSVDIDSGEVTRYHQPLRLVGDEVATYTERYTSIHPIYGGNLAPVLFHCYSLKD